MQAFEKIRGQTTVFARPAKPLIFSVDRKTETVFPLPSAASSSAGGNGIKGEDCLRPVGPSSAAPPLRPSSAEHPA